MDNSQRAQIETYTSLLGVLIDRGRELSGRLAGDPSDESVIADTRVWQEDCGVTINQLSGGSKAHWLARAFSGAFLLRSADGRAAEGAAPGKIVQRLLGVLEKALASLSGMDDGAVVSPSSEAAPVPRRFDFVNKPELRPVIEQAYRDSRGAIDRGDFELALVTSCGILEAIVTDALEHRGMSAIDASGLPAAIADWPFETRLDVAERVGLIRGGCARLPAVARAYRDGAKAKVSESDARRSGQVLHVVMRDLDPGR